MRVLFVGDVVGKPGRRIVKSHLQPMIDKYQIDFIIVNGENAAHGKGITKRLYNELISAGANCITLGNHAFAKSEILDQIEECEFLIRPANLEPLEVGHSTLVFNVKNQRLAVTSLLGEVFMNNVTESPINVMHNILEVVECDLHIVDFHAEATAEKQTFFYYFKEKLSAILGTHTHVTTADEHIMDGCAYITDVGMTGVKDSILGRDVNEVIQRTIHNVQTHYTIASGDAMLNAVLIDFENGNATNIERLRILENSPEKIA